jgi:hypothetical protein
MSDRMAGQIDALSACGDRIEIEGDRAIRHAANRLQLALLFAVG